MGVWILPFLVAGILDRGRLKPIKPGAAPAAAQEPSSTGDAAAPTTDAAAADVNGDAAPAVADTSVHGGDGTHDPTSAGTPIDAADPEDGEAAEGLAPARALLRALWGGGDGGEEAPFADDEEDASPRTNDGAVDKEHTSAVRANARFDWTAYRDAFPDTPPHAAITAMFAEYALLVGRITRHLGAAVASPVTLAEGQAIAAEAQEFVLRYAVPILGPLHTTKVHKLLAHLMEAVRLHGNLMNGDTGKNEQQHKDDKRHYVRTNKSKSGYLRQLVRHANGARAVLRWNKAAGASAAAARVAAIDSDGDERGSGSDGYEAEDEGLNAPHANANTEPVNATASTGSANSTGTPCSAPSLQVGAAPVPVVPRPADSHLRQMTVAKLASYPGLAGVGGLLGLSALDRVRVLTSVYFVTRVPVPGGFRERQLARASPAYRGASWYDFVEFRADDDGAGAPERFGQVRALLRLEGEDIAVVAELVRTGVTDGPLTSRGCTHLRWACRERLVAGHGNVRLLRVPLKLCHRIVHVVPDFAELFLRRGVGAIPTELGGAAEDVCEQRYLLNVFCPSGGTRVNETEGQGDET